MNEQAKPPPFWAVWRPGWSCWQRITASVIAALALAAAMAYSLGILHLS